MGTPIPHRSKGQPVGRYAPSPTGQLHLGNARTALLAWLQIRSLNGTFILRMEDLDPSRSSKDFARQILDDLRWLGLDWDEGPDIGGPCGPYNQSERSYVYSQVIEQLRKEDYIFPCACSRKDLASLAQAPHGIADEGPPYPGICRALSRDAWLAKLQAKGQYAYRFKAHDGVIRFEDGIAGPVEQNIKDTVGDFVVCRADKITAYQLAVVADDALMGVTHVLRGDDLLYSTPRQILLYQALAFPVPRFFHVPLMLGPDGTRLSKRHGSTAIHSLRESGVKSEQVVGFLAASLGLLPEPTAVHPRELIARFSINKLPRQPFIVSLNPMTATKVYQ